jgi:hypothetical protein
VDVRRVYGWLSTGRTAGELPAAPGPGRKAITAGASS